MVARTHYAGSRPHMVPSPAPPRASETVMQCLVVQDLDKCPDQTGGFVAQLAQRLDVLSRLDTIAF